MALASWIRTWKRSIELRWERKQALLRKAVARCRSVRLGLEPLEDRWLLSAYVVTSTADDGSAGTLRDAINRANATGSTITEIDFNIGTAGSAQTINLASQLPAVTAKGVFINGLSQGGSGNTKHLITLNGTNAGSQSDGLLLQGASCTVSGLILSDFTNGIEVDGSNTIIGGTATGAGNIISANAGDGLLIDSGISGVQVQGNYIGTNTTGDIAQANNDGIVIGGNNNTVGGTVSGARNIISGNGGDDVQITGNSNQVLGNYIGTNAAGNAPLSDGTGIEIDSSNNTVGGTSPGAANLISGNGTQGVFLNGSGNQVLGNSIGTNAAGNAILTNGTGIEIDSSNNTVGGTASGAGNLISGNGNGIFISSGSGNRVLGNSIGTDAAGNSALANGNGIEIVSSNNIIGGTSPGAANLISGNGDGILLSSGSDSNQVLGNSIGTDAAGNATLANGSGIVIDSSNNTVGGTASGAGNLISGNTIEGVYLSGSSNLVLGNSIGTNAAGSAALANKVGILIDGNSNTVGGSGFGAANFISGNSSDGVLINGSGNQVLGNSIGTNPAGTAAVANGSGIMIDGSSNTVGGTSSGAGNLISGNTSDGVFISAGDNNQVLGNSIGTNPAGNAALANKVGIVIDGSGNTVGGTATEARNLISGNSNDGVLLDVFGSDNQVMGNYIGTDVTGAYAVANSVGVEVSGGSNTLGGTATGAGNVISGNSGDGVLLDSAGSGNQVMGNSIGTNVSSAALSNGHYGVNISGSTNSIGGSVASAGNTIADNTQGGVLVSKGSGNTIRLNSIFANGSTNTGPGITISNGANNDLAAPSLASALINSNTLTVSGSFVPPKASVSYVLNFYANLSGDAEGRVSLGSLTVTPNSTDTQSFTFTTTTTVTGTYPLITATLTDASGNSSSFSNGVTVANGPPTSPSSSYPPPNGPLLSSSPPILDVPPLLALINIFFGGGIETVNGNGTETLTDSLFGIPLLVETFDSSGNLMSVSLLGINVTFLFG